MCTFLVYILPIILVILECWFLRTCIRFDNGKKTSRLVMLSLIMISFVPILVLIESLLALGFILCLIAYEDIEITDNKFTRFWIKDQNHGI